MNGMNQANPPGLAALRNYGVNVANVQQVFWQPLYDYQEYDAAGVQTLTFFQQPKGAGGRTLEDTNMLAAGQLPSPMRMLVLGVEIAFFSGAAVSGLQTAAPAGLELDDLSALQSRGHLQFNIGQKSFLDEAPIDQFPRGVFIDSRNALADSTTAGADQLSVISSAQFGGRPYRIVPLTLEPTQNFDVSINFPNGVVALPSGVNGRIGVRLIGYQYRLAQ